MTLKKTNKPDKIEYKKFDFEQKKLTEDSKYFYFEGYLSVFGNVDRGGDVINKGAFVDSLKEHDPILFWSHKSDEPLGIFVEAYEDSYGLYVKGKMPKADTFVSDRIIPQMEVGSIKSMSVGFSIVEKGAEMIDGIRHLNKLFLWEGSLVTIPMNGKANLTKSAAPVQDIPIADRQTGWNSWDAELRVRDLLDVKDGALADIEIQKEYQKVFLYHDQDEPDKTYSYSFLIADVIEGELKIVPRALFSAAGVMQSKKYPVYMPPADIVSVVETIKEYYIKMKIDSPFGDEKSFHIDDLGVLDDNILEKLFCSGIKVSKKNAKKLVSFVKSGLEEASEDKECDAPLVEQKNSDLNWSEVLTNIKSINKK